MNGRKGCGGGGWGGGLEDPFGKRETVGCSWWKGSPADGDDLLIGEKREERLKLGDVGIEGNGVFGDGVGIEFGGEGFEEEVRVGVGEATEV